MVAGHIGDIGADAHVVDIGGLDDVVNMAEKRVDVTRVAEETRDAGDAGESAGVGDGLEHLVRLAANVLVQIRGATMAGKDGFFGNPCGL